MAHSFLDRGYPQDLVEAAMVKARRQDRDDLLREKGKSETEKGNSELSYLITTYNPARNILDNIVKINSPILTENPLLRGFENLSIKPVYRRPKSLKDILVKAALPPKTNKPKNPHKKCYNINKCRYCPKIDKSGRIKSSSTGREYSTKTNVCCQSNNIIYCITCRRCALQYVGQCGRRVMDRFQGHFGGISRKDKSTLINDHFNLENHKGIEDMLIHILDFVHSNPASEQGKKLRLDKESV